MNEQATRRIVRWRSHYKLTIQGLLFNQYGLEAVHFLMERKMLLGIKDRVELVASQVPDRSCLWRLARSARRR